jgi:hypothetical protein
MGHLSLVMHLYIATLMTKSALDALRSLIALQLREILCWTELDLTFLLAIQEQGTKMTKVKDASQKFLIFVLTSVLSKIVSSLSMTQTIFKFLHANSERNHKLGRIAIQN